MSPFSSSDISVLTPTKDRPHKIVNLLDSLVAQTKQVGRVVVVGSGQNIGEIVRSYDKKLNIEYYHSDIAGQIRQRKLGVTKLDNRTRLVATLDDDIILKSDAIENLISFWNTKDQKTAGIGFNITNMQRHEYSRFKKSLYLSLESPGRVISSGYTTSLVNIDSDIKTNWLNGGATVWKQNILVDGIHKKNMDSPWAPCEDLMFSYPISKKFDLWVCKSAEVIHDDKVVFQNISTAIQRGRLLSQWTLEFVKQNKDLSTSHFTIATISSSLLNMLRKIYKIEFFFELGRILFLFKK